MFVVLDACKIIFVKLNNEEMFLSFNDSHLLIWTNVLRDTVDSGLQVLDSSICHWNLDSGFQLLVRFRIPWAVFRIPKPRVPVPRAKFVRIPISTKGRFWNHRRSHTTITLRCKPNQSNFSDAATCDALRCKGRSAFIHPFRMPVKQQ